MREKISFIQFLFSSIIGLYALIMIIYINIIFFSPTQLLFMTMWNCHISTIYLIILAICDFSLFVLKSNKLEKINEFFRERLSPGFTAITYLVTFTFWAIIFPVLINEGDSNFGIGLYLNLYVHLFLTILQTVDIFLSYRKNKGIIIKYDFLVAAFIMGMYAILTLILVFGFNTPVYPFLNNMTWYKAIGEILIFEIMIFLFYLVHVGLIKLKFKCKIYILKEEEEEKDKLPEYEQDKNININY